VSDPIELRFVGDVQKLHLAPGDALVITTERSLSSETANRLIASVQSKFPGHKVIVMSDGLKLSVATCEER